MTLTKGLVLGTSNFRYDIAGLRAIAVLAVVIFHIQEHWLPGGFVGVDIFFVISGYLISQQLYRQISEKRFSIADFYQRRIRRIVPAMLVVTGITVVLAQLLYIPEDAEAVAESGLWATASMANVYFWLFQDTSYFANSSLELPLLHFWSLGIEEQFYLFWPLILLGLSPWLLKKRMLWLLLPTIALSTLLGEWLYDDAQSFVYYMLPTRAGELMVGALAAWLHLQSLPKRWLSRQTVGGLQALGLLFIALSIILYNGQTTVFPGIAALLPTFGTGLLLFAGHYHQTRITALLSNRVFYFFGLISYSMYLWHWPVLAFYRYGQFDITPITAIPLFLLITLLGYLGFRWVEEPFRHAKRPIFSLFCRYYALPGTAIIIFCLVAMKLDGFTFRLLSPTYMANYQQAQSESTPAYKLPYVCQSNTLPEGELDNPLCVTGEKGGDNAILIGDSNAAHYVGVLNRIAEKTSLRIRNVALGSCPPVIGDPGDFSRAERAGDCRDKMPNVMSKAMTYDTIFISASWESYRNYHAQFDEQLFKTLSYFSDNGKSVVLIGKAPVFYGFDRRCPIKAIGYPGVNCQQPDQSINEGVKRSNEKLKSLAEQIPNVEYMDFNDIICPNGRCTIYAPSGDVYYYDKSHLNVEKTDFIAEQWLKNGATAEWFRRYKNEN